MAPFNENRLPHRIATNGQIFEYFLSQTDGNEIMIISSSLLFHFRNAKCDLLSIPGCRAEDVPAFLPLISLQRYKKVVLMFGANGLVDRYRNNVKRPATSPFQITQLVLRAVNVIRNEGCKVYFLGLPPRLLPNYKDIALLKQEHQSHVSNFRNLQVCWNELQVG